MKTKRVNRYYCDFCKKAGCRKDAIVKHELHCTANPHRKCRMCDVLDQHQPDLAMLVSLLPNPEKYRQVETMMGFDSVSFPGLSVAFESVLPKLRDSAGECPVCILAAIRQAGLGGYLDSNSFDYKKEVAEVWKDINAERVE